RFLAEAGAGALARLSGFVEHYGKNIANPYRAIVADQRAAIAGTEQTATAGWRQAVVQFQRFEFAGIGFRQHLVEAGATAEQRERDEHDRSAHHRSQTVWLRNCCMPLAASSTLALAS